MSRLSVQLWSLLCISQVFAVDKNWWKHSTMYEVYTPSFKDSNGDGWGDLKGITSKLDYLHTLGVDTIYLTPYHPSPMLDTGYDVSDYMAINPLFGTMDDFDELMRQLEKRDMKMIMDLVINHSSDKHTWFNKSVDRIYPYTDYYVWRDPKGYDNQDRPVEPNNWCSLFGSSAWTWNEKRKQFYYHVFLPQQPDLNHRNHRVVNEMKKIIKFWLNKGVAGMRLDATHYLFEDPLFKDQDPYDAANKGKKVGCHELQKTKTENVAENFKFIGELREYIDQLSRNMKSNKLERLLIFGSIWYEGRYEKVLWKCFPSWLPLCVQLFLRVAVGLSAPASDKIHDRLLDRSDAKYFNFKLDGCHDRFRSSFKFIQEYVNIMLTLISTLPGVMVLYYGEEIGMTAGVIRPHQRRMFSEYARTPMQWDGSSNGGFSSNSKSWLPVNPNYWRLNVKKEKSDKQSVYNFVQNLLTLRRSDVLKYGDFKKFILDDWILVLKRSFKGQTFIIVLNLGTEKEKIYLDPHLPNLPAELKVHLATPNGGFKKGAFVVKKKKRSFVMNPMSAAILS